MTNDLKDTIDNRQFHQCYPMAYLDNIHTTNKDEFINKLDDAVKALHSLVLSKADISEEIIKSKDLTDITFYLTDKLYELTH